MTRAEQAALKAYPPHDGASEQWKKAYLSSLSEYIQGYEHAEQDLTLTIEDIELLHTFLYAVKNNKQGVFTFTRLSNEQYEEVLRRFRETKNK